MIRHLMAAGAIYLALILQPSLAATGVLQARPWLPGMVVVVVAMLVPGPAGVLWSGVLGLGVDGLTLAPPGIQLVAAVTVAAVLRIINADAGTPPVFLFLLQVAFATAVWRMSSILLLAELDDRDLSLTVLSKTVACEALTTATLAGCLAAVACMSSAALRRNSGSATVLRNEWSMLTGR